MGSLEGSNSAAWHPSLRGTRNDFILASSPCVTDFGGKKRNICLPRWLLISDLHNHFRLACNELQLGIGRLEIPGRRKMHPRLLPVSTKWTSYNKHQQTTREAHVTIRYDPFEIICHDLYLTINSWQFSAFLIVMKVMQGLVHQQYRQFLPAESCDNSLVPEIGCVPFGVCPHSNA